MCGLTGYLTKSFADESEMQSTIDCMSSKLIHRGPDDQHSWINPDSGIAMGFCRLAILELSDAGKQPMKSNSARFVMTFNGEIYNHNELRIEITKECGNDFLWKGSSDSETLLAAFELWGVKKTLQFCSGMFAISLWDTSEKILTLARDRFGEKPLYYGMVDDALIFGSELKPFKEFPGFKNKISRKSLSALLKYNYVPSPLSIYQDIFKLESGTFAQFIIKNDMVQQIAYKKYWSLEKTISLSKESTYQSMQKATEDLENQLKDSIKSQMQSDVPLGAFLSGGVDSSLIVSIMQEISDQPVKTFTVGFEDSEFDESKFAKDIANHLGTEHTELFVTPEEVRSIIPRLPYIYDEPFADSSQIPTYIVSTAASKHVKVALSGDAGDELFGGYNRYFWGPSLWKKLKIVPFHLRKLLGKFMLSVPKLAWQKFENLINFFLSSDKGISRLDEKSFKIGSRLQWIKSLDDLYFSLVSEWQDTFSLVIGLDKKKEVFPKNFLTLTDFTSLNLEEPSERMMYQDSKTYLQDDILCKVDRAAMATSLETRVPFLDPSVFKLSWRFPINMKIQGTMGKSILRNILYKYIPRNLIDRPKTGFGLPIGSWLRGPLRSWAGALLEPQRIKNEGYLNFKQIDNAWQEHLSGKRDNTSKLWSVLMFQAWLEAQRNS